MTLASRASAADRPALLAIWTDIDQALEADFNEWYWREHLPERLSVPGFRRGRRFRALAGSPRYFACYELDGLATLASPAYLERLDQPTAWTRRVMGGFRNTVRAGFERVANFGEASGAVLLTLRLAPRAEATAAFDQEVREHLLPTLQSRPGIIRAQHWRAKPIAAPKTAEAGLRGAADQDCAEALIVEAAGAEDLAAAERDIAAAALQRYAAQPPLTATYRLLCSLG
ncbi:MAG TPA: hypothetical protein VE397_14675 [Stellaceae bacterium]|nr:hypothetical protein [Stellaceae bacterium]